MLHDLLAIASEFSELNNLAGNSMRSVALGRKDRMQIGTTSILLP